MKIRPVAKTICFTGLLFSLISCAILTWAFLTVKGTDVSLGVLQNHMHNLSYTYKSGNLAQGIVFEDLKWNLKNKTQISAKDIEVDWDASCWRGRELCIKSAHVGEVKIVIAHKKEKSNPIVPQSIKLPFALIADELVIDQLTIENGAPKPLVLHNLFFKGSLKKSKLNAESVSFDWEWIQANAKGSMKLINNYPIELSGNVNSVKGSLALPVSSTVNISGDLLTMITEATLTAPYPANISGSLSPLTRNFPANLDIRWNSTQWPRGSDQPATFADDGHFQITGLWPDYDINGNTKVYGPGIPSMATSMTGTINTKRATFNPLHVQTLDGLVNAIGVFKWRNGLSWQAKLTTDSINPGVYWPQFKGTIAGTANLGGRTNNGLTQLNLTEIDTTGNFSGTPFSVTGSATKDADGTYFLSAVEARSENNTLNANGVVGAQSDMSVYFSFKSPQDFYPALQGNINGQLDIKGDIKKPDITGSGSASTLHYQNIKLVNTKVDGVLRRMGEHSSQLHGEAETLVINNQTINNASISVNGSVDNHVLQASLLSKPFLIDKMRVAGSLDEHNNWTGMINRVNGMVGTFPVTLEKPFSSTWIKDNRTLALQPHCWNFDLASACLKESALIGRTGVVNFDVNGLDLQAIEGITPPNINIAGKLQSDGVVQWGENLEPSINIDSELTEASITVFDQALKENFHADLDRVSMSTKTDNRIVYNNLRIGAKKLGQISAIFSVDTNDKPYPLTGTLNVSDSQLSQFRNINPKIQTLQGLLSVNAAINGTLSAPEFDGTIKINDGAVASPLMPVDLDGIDLELLIDGKNAEVTGTAKTAGQEVRLQGTGQLSDTSWKSDLHIQADRIPVSHEYLENAVISPDLTLKLNPNGVEVSGNIHVPKAKIKLTDFGDSGVPISRDVVIVDAKEMAPVQRKKLQQNISTQVDILLGRNVQFEGYGLNAKLGGDFNVRLSPQRTPELLGEIKLYSGTYRSYGQNLIIKDGRINFVGPLEQTGLSVEAVREVGSVLAGLRVDGSLQDPATVLFSEPQLPEEEILSYIVLGRQLKFGSENREDSNLLANAALFMGISNGRALSKNVAESLGIDDFDLSASGTGEDTQVMLSGRLNNRLLVRYGVGIFNSVNTLFLRYDLAEKLYLETSQGLEKAVDVFYSFEFD